MSTVLIVSLICIFIGGFGAILLAIDQFNGTELLKKQIIKNKDSVIKRLESENLELKSKIADLKSTTSDQTNELKEKQKKIEDLSKLNIKFSKKINVISDNTNTILKTLKSEQALKGNLTFDGEDYDNYSLVMGGVVFQVYPKEKLIENTHNIYGIPVSFVLFKGQIYTSIELRNQNGDLIFQMKKGDWALTNISIFSFNYDESGLEIINDKGQILLQIILDRKRIIVRGVFFQKNGIAIIHGGNSEYVEYGDANMDDKLSKHFNNLKQIFVHHGQNYIGKRIKE